LNYTREIRRLLLPSSGSAIPTRQLPARTSRSGLALEIAAAGGDLSSRLWPPAAEPAF